MDPRIAQIIASLRDESTRAAELEALDDAALAALETELLDAFRSVRAGEVEGTEPDDLEVLASIRDAVAVLRGETATRETAAAEALAAAEDRAAQAAAMDAELNVGPEDDEPEGDPEPEAVQTAVETPVAQAAAAVAATPPVRRPASLAEMAATAPTPTPRVPAVTRPRWQTLDGAYLANLDDIADRVREARETLISTPRGFTDKIVVARIKANYPNEMVYGDHDDIVTGTMKAKALMSAGQSRETWEAARRDPVLAPVVASGGWCAPLEPKYDFINVASQNRPVRGGLPTMGVNRGGVTFARAPGLSSIVTTGSGAAVSQWTAATDASPGETTKPSQTFACRDLVERSLYAVLLRAKFGNFQGRAWPEMVADDVELALAAHARLSETLLLDAIISQINIDVVETGLTGTARDLKIMLAQAAAQLEYLERSETPVRAIIAREALRMVVQDITLQQASGEVAAVMVDQAWARTMLASSDVNIAYALDHSTGPDAIVGNSDAGGQNLADYPDTLEIPVFFEGSVLFLDGGRLDVGIIRDSTLNDTNDYEMFVETFEDAAWLGPRGLTVTLTTCPNGESQVATDETGSICSGS